MQAAYSDPYLVVCRALGVAPSRGVRIHATCPNCGKEPKRGQRHFAFDERGGHCFVCNWGSGCEGIARRLGGATVGVSKPSPRPAPRPLPPAGWTKDPERWARLFAAMPDRVSKWQAYRPLTPATIDRWQLGVGPLPDFRPCLHRRLIIPVRSGNVVVGFAGRAFCCPPECESAKWVMSRGSEFGLFNLDSVTTGCVVVVTENRADAILAGQQWPDIVTVARGSAETWKPEWTERLVEARPACVLFWPDHDRVGYRGAAVAANELIDHGLVARVRRWSDEAPPKADLGLLLMAELEARDAA